MDQELERRLWRHIRIDPITGCWLWTGSLNEKGYAKVAVGRKRRRAHIVMFELWTGASLAPGIELDHLCARRQCVNPRHLDPVTHAINTARRTSPDATRGLRERAEARRHAITCRYGHPYAPDNTIRTKSGARVCRHCRKLRPAGVALDARPLPSPSGFELAALVHQAERIIAGDSRGDVTGRDIQTEALPAQLESENAFRADGAPLGHHLGRAHLHKLANIPLDMVVGSTARDEALLETPGNEIRDADAFLLRDPRLQGRESAGEIGAQLMRRLDECGP